MSDIFFTEFDTIVNINSKKHYEKFDVYPIIIGMYWINPEQIQKNILKAIKENKPYDEYNLLTIEEQKEYNNGDLVF